MNILNLNIEQISFSHSSNSIYVIMLDNDNNAYTLRISDHYQRRFVTGAIIEKNEFIYKFTHNLTKEERGYIKNKIWMKSELDDDEFDEWFDGLDCVSFIPTYCKYNEEDVNEILNAFNEAKKERKQYGTLWLLNKEHYKATREEKIIKDMWIRGDLLVVESYVEDPRYARNIAYCQTEETVYHNHFPSTTWLD